MKGKPLKEALQSQPNTPHSPFPQIWLQKRKVNQGPTQHEDITGSQNGPTEEPNNNMDIKRDSRAEHRWSNGRAKCAHVCVGWYLISAASPAPFKPSAHARAYGRLLKTKTRATE